MDELAKHLHLPLLTMRDVKGLEKKNILKNFYQSFIIKLDSPNWEI